MICSKKIKEEQQNCLYYSGIYLGALMAGQDKMFFIVSIFRLEHPKCVVDVIYTI